ncbi:MAG: glycosyltransferase [Verrucomicrobiota bacterium]
MISFIVPAHNEEACLPGTLRAIHESAREVGQQYEIIVVDDTSTDGTAEVARQNHARVVSVNHRQIAATRNSGGRAAQGERLFFVDADTTINARAVAAALRCMDEGAVGGGAPAWVGRHEAVPIYIRIFCVLAVFGPKLVGFTGGAFMFCTWEAFRVTGGFSERMYWGEEGSFALALKREGRFAVLWEGVLTSGRRFRKVSGLQMLAGALRMMVSPYKMVTQRASVEKVWYDSNRTDDDIMPDSWGARISNGIVLLLVLDLLTGLIWDFVPWSLTPVTTPLGTFRFFNSVFLCHVGVILWAPAAVLFANLLRQKRWVGAMQTTALIVFLVWNAWGATRAVIRMWKVSFLAMSSFFPG